jgi:hypothetical protein
MAAFDFQNNPFYLLGVSPRDGREALAEAVEDAVSSGRTPEKDAFAAHRTLMAAKPRLEAEVAWFPGVAPSTVSRILNSIGPGQAHEAWSDPPALVRANIAAHRASRRDANAPRELVDAQAGIDPDTTLSAINADRSVAGFPQVDRALVEEALWGLKSAHVASAVDGLMASADPPRAAADLCTAFLPTTDRRRDFVEEVVERYDGAAAARLATAEQAVHKAVKTYADTGDKSVLDQVRAAMSAWRTETEARRLVFFAKNLDEPRSGELFKSIRELGKELVQQRALPERAQALFGALRVAFVDVPSVADQMDRDTTEIAEIVMQKRFEREAGDLVTAITEARENVKAAIRSLRRGGFKAAADGVAGRLYAGFDKAAKGMAGTQYAALPWNGVRQLAIEFTNEAKAPAAARILVEGLARYEGAPTPADIAKLLSKDRRALDNIELSTKLGAALKANRLSEGLRIVAALEPVTDDEEERATLRAVRAKLEAGIRSRRNTLIGWSVAIAVVIGLAALNDQETKTTSTYTPRAEPQNTYTPPPYTPPSEPVDSPTSVEMPPVSTQRTLSRQELRWCVFQLQRLKDVQSLIPNPAAPYEADSFNAAAGDWRSRCKENYYDKSDKAIVDQNVAAYSDQLSLDADHIVRDWRQEESSATPAPPPAPILAPAHAPRLLNLLRRGDVAAIQRQLSAQGFYRGLFDGAWGPSSRAALKRFKQANGLPADDVWDADTQAKLFGGTQ